MPIKQIAGIPERLPRPADVGNPLAHAIGGLANGTRYGRDMLCAITLYD